MRQLRYDTYKAIDCGYSDHPQDVMRELGFTLIHSVPHSISEQWWFTVEEDYIELPEFLTEMTYDLAEWGYYEDLVRKEKARIKELQEAKIANQELPEGWKPTEYKKDGLVMPYVKIYNDDKLEHYYIFVQKGNEKKGFDKVTGQWYDINGSGIDICFDTEIMSDTNYTIDASSVYKEVEYIEPLRK